MIPNLDLQPVKCGKGEHANTSQKHDKTQHEDRIYLKLDHLSTRNLNFSRLMERFRK